MEYEVYLVIRVTQDMLEGTTLESIQQDVKYHAEKSGYVVDDVWNEEVKEEHR